VPRCVPPCPARCHATAVYPYTTFQEAEAELRSAGAAASTRELLARGENRFNAFCAPCHSVSGQDTTEVVRKGMQKPPSLLQNAPNALFGCALYHIISAGQNIMPGYADKLKPEDRWAVVAYMRELQKAPLRHPLPTAAPATATADSTAKKPASPNATGTQS
jgi:mono/diheme cytochrome c family protein